MKLIEINGPIDSYGYQRSLLRYNLHGTEGQDVVVRISSFGGDVNEAMKIAQMFADHGSVTVQFLGMVASAVTWMAFGAAKVQICEDALWLCHKCSTEVYIYKSLNADQIDEKIKELEKAHDTAAALDLIIAKKYSDKSGKKLDEMLDLMSEEKWLTASAVKSLGLVDEVIKASGSVQNHRDLLVKNCADLGLPAPNFEQEKGKSSLVDAIINRCKELFVPKNEKNEGAAADDPKVEEIINNNIEKLMNKTFTAVNSVLGVEGVTENEGSVTLTSEQMTAINSALAEKDAAQNQLKEVGEVLDSIEGNKKIDGLKNKAQSLVNLINRVPILGKTPEDNGDHHDENEGDPINAEAKKFHNSKTK